ncbi:MAG: Zn-ribbon domain-containing protein [Methanobacterium sp.]
MHLCIKCGAIFKGKPEDILKGCPDCGSHFFEYHPDDDEKEKPSGKSVETIMVHDHGIYEVDLPTLMEDDSIIVSDEEGKYLIDINFLFKKKMKEKDKL